MSGLDLSVSQDAIEAYIAAEFPNYAIYDSDVIDDEFIIKQGNKVKPYIVLRWGGIFPGAGKSFIGARYDEYTSTVDVEVIAPTAKQARRALNIILDRLVGYKPTGSSPMTISGGVDILGLTDYDGKPNVYLASTRFEYAINSENVGAYITP